MLRVHHKIQEEVWNSTIYKRVLNRKLEKHFLLTHNQKQETVRIYPPDDKVIIQRALN